jgi:hypothetical protein
MGRQGIGKGEAERLFTDSHLNTGHNPSQFAPSHL